MNLHEFSLATSTKSKPQKSQPSQMADLQCQPPETAGWSFWAILECVSMKTTVRRCDMSGVNQWLLVFPCLNHQWHQWRMPKVATLRPLRKLWPVLEADLAPNKAGVICVRISTVPPKGHTHHSSITHHTIQPIYPFFNPSFTHHIPIIYPSFSHHFHLRFPIVPGKPSSAQALVRIHGTELRLRDAKEVAVEVLDAWGATVVLGKLLETELWDWVNG